VEHLLLQDRDELDRTVNTLIARGEERELLDRLSDLPALITKMRQGLGGDQFHVNIPLSNATLAAEIALKRDRPGAFSHALAALVDAYRVGDVHTDSPNMDDTRLFESAATSLWGLGAFATHEGKWDAVREIVTHQPEQGGHYATWLRHSQVMSARGALYAEDDNILDLGGGLAEHQIRALAAFDQLALLVVESTNPGDRPGMFPSYAKFPVAYVEPLVIELRAPGPMRSAIFPSDNEQLRGVLRNANEIALLQAAQFRHHGHGWRYEGFRDPRTWTFIRSGQMWEDWQDIRI
jgi:hypothetical protein